MDFSALEKEASRYENQLRAHRRALHQIPEVGYEEHETHAYLMEQLRALAPDDLKTYAETGIRAVFRGDGTGRVTAFRSDIDALPISEKTGCVFASRHPGKMHACGHDGHMANLLTFAQWLSEHRASLRDDVVLLFQPAEETIGGAKNMYAVANVFGIQWALRVSATICFIMVVMVFFGVRGNGAGSTRDTVQRALNRVHPHAA